MCIALDVCRALVSSLLLRGSAAILVGKIEIGINRFTHQHTWGCLVLQGTGNEHLL